MTTGIIYLLTAPDGKRYVGQTCGTLQERVHQHAQKANRITDYDNVMYAHVRKHGIDNFQGEVLVECPAEQLDIQEITCIKELNTLKPNGLNSKPGGRFTHSKFENLPNSLQKFCSDALRKHTNYDLPPGVVEINCEHNGNIETGFKVLGERTYTFISVHETMEQKLTAAMECYEKISKGETYVRKNHHKWNKDRPEIANFDIPEGIKYRYDKGGFEVHIKLNGRVHRKTFTKKKFTMEQNLQSAIAHLQQLKAQNALIGHQ